MNSEAPVVAKNRGLGFGQTLNANATIHFLLHQRHAILGCRIDQRRDRLGGGWSGGCCGRSRSRSRWGWSGVVGPRGRDDLGDADVTAVPAGLGAKLAYEVWRESKDQGGEAAVERYRSARRVEPAVARLLIPSSDIRRAGEVGFRATLEWGKNPRTRGHGHSATTTARYCLGLSGDLWTLLLFLTEKCERS